MERSHKCVLLVADEPSGMLLMQQLLDEEYELLLARDSAEALVLWDDKNPAIDLIVLDLKVSQQDSMSLQTLIRRKGLGKNIPILVLSALDCNEISEHHQLTYYLQKPVNIALLHQLTHRLLDKRAIPLQDSLCQSCIQSVLDRDFHAFLYANRHVHHGFGKLSQGDDV